jgi:hypothetical protein
MPPPPPVYFGIQNDVQDRRKTLKTEDRIRLKLGSKKKIKRLIK